MSLEQALKENTEAIKALTAQLAGSAAKAPAADKAEKTEMPAKSADKPKAAAAPREAPATTPKEASDNAAYIPVKAAILDAIKNGHRTAITNLLKEYGAKTGQDLAPGVYDEVLGKIADITGELA